MLAHPLAPPLILCGPSPLLHPLPLWGPSPCSTPLPLWGPSPLLHPLTIVWPIPLFHPLTIVWPIPFVTPPYHCASHSPCPTPLPLASMAGRPSPLITLQCRLRSFWRHDSKPKCMVTCKHFSNHLTQSNLGSTIQPSLVATLIWWSPPHCGQYWAAPDIWHYTQPTFHISESGPLPKGGDSAVRQDIVSRPCSGYLWISLEIMSCLVAESPQTRGKLAAVHASTLLSVLQPPPWYTVKQS